MKLRRRAPSGRRPMLRHSVRNAPDGNEKNSASPEMLSEPGPGRSAIESSAGLPVAGMQKLLTRTEGCDKPSERSPSGEPQESGPPA